MNTSNLSVFVYGTLKPGGHYWPEFCEGKVGEPIPAKIRGELYDLHVGYPGLWLGGPDSDRAMTGQEKALNRIQARQSVPLPNAGWVQGCILSFKTEKDFLRLDYLEGYDPNRPYSKNEYIRLKVPGYRPDGEPLGEVWTYEMTDTTMARHKGTLIEDGNWPV